MGEPLQSLNNNIDTDHVMAEDHGYKGKAENQEEEKTASPVKYSLNPGSSLFGAPSAAPKAKSKKKWMRRI